MTNHGPDPYEHLGRIHRDRTNRRKVLNLKAHHAAYHRRHPQASLQPAPNSGSNVPRASEVRTQKPGT